MPISGVSWAAGNMSTKAINIKDQTDLEIAPCLREGPLSESGRAFVSAAARLGKVPHASVLRTWCIPSLFLAMEEILRSGDDPFLRVNSTLDNLTEFLEAAERVGLVTTPSGANSEIRVEETRDVEVVTGDHYGNLFKSFSSVSYWDEPVTLLEQRLERNGVSIPDIKNKKTLDAGCGGGRYTVAWRLLGASPVIGLDISSINIEDANRRVREAKIDGVVFEEGNVLALPFDDQEFEIVFSNGVLHHTVDWEKGVRELVRVLKTGGLGWLYLIEKPGGVFWDVIEILRLLMKHEEKNTARAGLESLKIPANRIFYMLDHVMVPINIRLSTHEIEKCLREAGAINVRRLDRGSDFDRVEQIYQENKFAIQHFGVGENRYVFSK